jgi:hypothetical protein
LLHRYWNAELANIAQNNPGAGCSQSALSV